MMISYLLSMPSLIGQLKKHQVIGLFFIFCLLTLAGVPRFLSLDAHWSSDEIRWLYRSSDFMASVKHGYFSETVRAYHPGVTTMWIAGLRTFFLQLGINVANLAYARWLIGVVVWIGICLACFLIYRLFGKWVSLASFACLAYSPLLISQTRRVHTDALATVFILLTVLLLIYYCQHREQRHVLMLSGVCFGLALLSKSYALILLPWVALCLFLFGQKSRDGFLMSLVVGVCFLSCATITVILVWPIFWTLPFGIFSAYLLGTTYVLVRMLKAGNIRLTRLSLWGAIAVLGVTFLHIRQTVRLVFDSVNWALTTAHEVEHFFLGRVVYDPGWLFYPLVLLIKSTPLMLPLAVIGCGLLWQQRKDSSESAGQLRMALALVAGILLFTLCLSATSKKLSRYLLPAFPMLEILAAIGLVESFKWGYTALRRRFGRELTMVYKNVLVVMACIGLFSIQVLPVLALHPYYGTYYNLCWKVTDITKLITVGDASGLDIAANYLNEKPEAQKLVVRVSPLATEFVKRYFQGHAYRADQEKGLSPDYEVVYIRDLQIGRVPQIGTLNGELEALITLNDIDYVWIYRIGEP